MAEAIDPIVLLPAPETDEEYRRVALLATAVVAKLKGGETHGAGDSSERG